MTTNRTLAKVVVADAAEKAGHLFVLLGTNQIPEELLFNDSFQAELIELSQHMLRVRYVIEDFKSRGPQ